MIDGLANKVNRDTQLSSLFAHAEAGEAGNNPHCLLNNKTEQTQNRTARIEFKFTGSAQWGRRDGSARINCFA